VSAFDSVGGIDRIDIWQGVAARGVQGDVMSLAVIELDAGAVVPEHRHENEQLGVLAAGSMRFRIGEEERVVQPGDTWVIRANVPHEVEAGPEGAVAIEVFSPRRDDWAERGRLEGGEPRWP
jgi:quercetin dioxygenase-like cupin family protein